jgi:DNA-damage-inducible protein J
MSANTLVQTRIDASVKKRATVVLESMGLTVSDAVRTLLTRTANEGVPPFSLVSNAPSHDAWFRAKVQEALDDSRPAIPHAEVEAHFAARRGHASRKITKYRLVRIHAFLIYNHLKLIIIFLAARENVNFGRSQENHPCLFCWSVYNHAPTICPSGVKR